MPSARRLATTAASDGREGLVAVWAVAVLVVVFWAFNPTAFVTEDAYFYLVSARRFARGQGQTFSGIFPTNGFHPLWLYVLYGWAWLCQRIRPSSLQSARFVVVPAALCLLWGTRQLLKLARALPASPALVAGVPVLFVGVMGLLGSEGHALFAAASTLLARLSEDDALASDREAVRTGLLAAVVVLARLDAIFWIGAVVAWLFIAHAHRVPHRRLFIGVAAFSVPLLAYLLTNVIWFGGLLPVSGWMKSSFPRLRTMTESYSLLGAFRGYSNLFGHGPIVIALLSFRAWVQRRQLVVPLLVGCLAHDVYTSLFGSYSEWYWYYVLNVMLAAICLDSIVARIAPGRMVTKLVAAAIAFGGVAGLIAIRRHSQVEGLLAFTPTKFLNSAGVRDQAVLVGDTPGYIAFYSDAEIVAADFLTASREMFERIARQPNPLRALFQVYREAGHPFAYVIWDGNRWLGASPDWRVLRLFHPKNGRDGEPFGELAMPPPILVSPTAVIWDVRGLSFDRSGS